MNAADFAVDPQGRELLQFEIAAYRMLTGSDPLPGYGGFDWSAETQHVFGDNLRRAALFLIAEDHDHHPYVMDFAQFTAQVGDPLSEEAVAPPVGCARSMFTLSAPEFPMAALRSSRIQQRYSTPPAPCPRKF